MSPKLVAGKIYSNAPATESIQFRYHIVFESLFKDFQSRGRNSSIICKLRFSKVVHLKGFNIPFIFRNENLSRLKQYGAPFTYTIGSSLRVIHTIRSAEG